ncbi:hypothetical protein CASFOL_002384 [Castilleja foliolosa]|uniref:Uncharacterized protein n=1 Tax=Castilleja foliolosa TaxID=1961234 RepID=A0ABD3EE61_9LAMI
MDSSLAAILNPSELERDAKLSENRSPNEPSPSASSVNHAQSSIAEKKMGIGIGALQSLTTFFLGSGHQLSFEVLNEFEVLDMDLAIDNPQGGNHGLPRCWVVGRNRPSLMPTNASRVITKIIMNDIHEDGVNWKKVPDTHKEIYFREFKNHFRWNPTDDSEVRNAFMKQAALRYADLMCRFKRDSGNGRPKCVSQAAWVKWLAFWSRPEVSRGCRPR